jgi:hypothetical protein
MCHCLDWNVDATIWRSYCLCLQDHRHNFWRGGGQVDGNALQYFIYQRIVFLLLSCRGANIKKWVRGMGKGCMFIKDWFKSVFPLFLTWFLHKLKFLIPTFDFSFPLFLAKVCLCSGQSKSVPNRNTLGNVKGKDWTDDRSSEPIGILLYKQWAGLFPQSNQYNCSIHSMNSLKLTHNGVLLPSI